MGAPREGPTSDRCIWYFLNRLNRREYDTCTNAVWSQYFRTVSTLNPEREALKHVSLNLQIHATLRK